MKEPLIQSLFSTPIYINNIDRDFTKDELDFVNNQKNYCENNEGNTKSTDNYILKKQEFKNIKKFLNECCQDYLNRIINTQNNIKLDITQSWLNYTKENQYHHSHAHPNSIISGVFYFDCDNDSIKFSNPVFYQTIKPLIKSYNSWNSETWSFSTKKGQLFMFPSSLIHQVDIKKGTNTRTSLSFNTFYKGILGSNITLTELIL